MPRSADQNPQARGANDVHNPLKGLLDYSAIAGTAGVAGGAIKTAVDSAIDGVVEFIKELTGIDLSGPATLIEGLLDVPLTVLDGTPLGALFSMLGSVFPFLQSVTGGAGGFNPLGALESWVVGSLVPAGGLGTGSPLPAINLFGNIAAELLGILPVGGLTSAAPNMVIPIFSPDTIAPNSDWIPDMTSERTPGNGSVKVIADGREKALRSGSGPTDIITVAEGQTVNPLIYVESQGYSGADGLAAYELQLAPFVNGVLGTFVTLAGYTPTGNVAWPGDAISGAWPVPAGVTGVQLRIHDTGAAVSGVFHFADGKLTRTTDVNIVPGLTPVLQAIDSSRHELMDDLATVARGIPIVGAEASDIIEAFSNFNPLNVAGTLGNELLHGDLKGIVNTLIDSANKQPVGTTTDGSLAQLYNAMTLLLHNTAGSDVTDFSDTTKLIPVDPTWTNYLDIVLVPRGQNGQTWLVPGFYGQGGHPGTPVMAMFVKGTHYDNTLTGVQITVHTDGSITAEIPGHSVTATPSTAAQSPHIGGGWVGIGRAEGIDFNGGHYATGDDQNTSGGNGLGPGGGGAGGNGTIFQLGGLGGPAGGWVRRRASAVTGQVSGSDVTGPTGGTVAVDSVSYNSITFTPSGAVDA